jgi:hypothetical protein
VVDEPYYLLEDEGYAFADPPSLEDFERQLERSIALVLGADKNTILDRSPADFLGYLLAHDEAAAFDADAWLGDVEEAMARLDLVVFCSIERPDRIGVEAAGRAWRRRVDGELRDIIMGDRWNWQIATVEVAGDPDDRVRQVLAALEAG